MTKKNEPVKTISEAKERLKNLDESKLQRNSKQLVNKARLIQTSK